MFDRAVARYTLQSRNSTHRLLSMQRSMASGAFDQRHLALINPMKRDAPLGSAFLRLFGVRLVRVRGWAAGFGVNKHSKVTSNLRAKMTPIVAAASINNPERRCPDGFKLAFGLSVLASDIQRFGIILHERERKWIGRKRWKYAA